MKHFRDRIEAVVHLKDFRPMAALLCVITLSIAVSTQNPLNNDGILYLQAAEAFAESGFKAAMEIYRWPFYSILIGSIRKLTGLSFELAAYTLNAAFFVVIVTAFITLVTELGGSRRTQFLAAILILSHPQLHHYQSYIIRDFGYLAFSLLSLLCLIRYHRQLRWSQALSWGLLISAATLFRPEGAVLSCFTPLVVLVRSDKGIWGKLRNTLRLYAVNIVAAAVLLILLFTSPDRSSLNLGRLNEVLNQFQNGLPMLMNSLQNKAALIGQALFNDPSDPWALNMTISGLIGICLYRLVATLGPLHTFLWGHAAWNRLIAKEGGARGILIFFTLLNLLIPVIHIGQVFLLSHRFFLLGSLLLLLWSPFSLDLLFQKWHDKRKPLAAHSLLFAVISVMIVIMFIQVFIPARPTKAYVVVAGRWLKRHMPSEARLYSNTPRLPYYAEKEMIEWDIFDNGPVPNWKSNDFVALRVKKKKYKRFVERLNQLELRRFKVFDNQKGDQVIILKPALEADTR